MSAESPISASATEIAATAAVNSSAFNFWTPAREQINVATSSTPIVKANFTDGYTPSFNFNWQNGFYIESAGDAHAEVVNRSTCMLYAMYSSSWNGTTFTAYKGGQYNLNAPFSTSQGNTDTASGIPLYAILIKPEEIQAGYIPHAIGIDAVAGALAERAVFPASAHESTPGPTNGVPYGALLRLKASFSTAGLGPQATTIANALKTYGGYVYDTGCCWVVTQFDAVGGQSSPYNSSDISGLTSKLNITDFDVVNPG